MTMAMVTPTPSLSGRDLTASGAELVSDELELKPLPKVYSVPSNSPEIDVVPRSRHTEPEQASLALDEIPASTQAKYRRNSYIQFAALCWLVFTVGWNDGTTGPLLPRMQHEYNLNYLVVSLIFVANAVGYIAGAAANIWLTDVLGLGKVVVLAACVQIAGYAIMIPAPPFPALVFAYVLIGFGLSVQTGQGNGFLGSLNEHMSTKLGIFHATYGFGAFVAPFVSTTFATQERWSFHYLISAGLQVSNLLSLILVFRFRKQADILADAGQGPNAAENGATSSESKANVMFKLPAVHLLAAFALIYVGTEVTLGGWIVSFVIEERNGGPSSGYISSGFFGGLALGRVCLMWLNKLVGEERIIYLYSLLAIGLELTVWFVPSIIQNAIAVSIIGLLLGPMFPIIVSQSSRILPRWLLTACVGWITGIGVTGSAVLPFVTGVLASRFGIKSLQPLMVSMMSVMMLIWVCVPKVNRRID